MTTDKLEINGRARKVLSVQSEVVRCPCSRVRGVVGICVFVVRALLPNNELLGNQIGLNKDVNKIVCHAKNSRITRCWDINDKSIVLKTVYFVEQIVMFIFMVGKPWLAAVEYNILVWQDDEFSDQSALIIEEVILNFFQ